MTATKTPAKFDAPVFADAKVPASNGKAAPNPYADKIAALAGDADNNGTSKVATVVTVPTDQVEAHVRLAQRAGKPLNVTVRKSVEQLPKGQTSITFWTVKQIVKTRKPTEAAPVAPTDDATSGDVTVPA